MNLRILTLSLTILVASLTNGQEHDNIRSYEWNAQKERAWAILRAEFPEYTSTDWALKQTYTWIQQWDAWAKVNDPELYNNPLKPLIYARRQKSAEIDSATKAAEQAKAVEVRVQASMERQREYSASQTKKDQEHNAIIAALEKNRPRFWVLFLCLPILALVGFIWNRDGIRRRGLWVYLAVAAGLIVLMKADMDVYGRYTSEFEVNSESNMRVFAGLLFAFAVGKRARNAGYRWWLAGLSGVPLIALPMVLHLLFFKGKPKTPPKCDEESHQ
jgi:hypothetical protein